MIIAIEAAPATGKSTTAEYLVRNHGALRIPEVNIMFKRPNPEPANWYFERELERWSTALKGDGPDRLTVLDGDPYQPVWFDWMYPDRPFAPWEDVLRFFEERPEAAYMPGFYVYLYVAEEERYNREMRREGNQGHDEIQAQAKYDRYASMRGAQQAFFDALGAEFPGFVLMQEAVDLPKTAANILAHPASSVDPQEVFRFMRTWLSQHAPDEFQIG